MSERERGGEESKEKREKVRGNEGDRERRDRERRMEKLRVWEKVDAVMASSCRQPQAPVILNRANSFTGCASYEGALHARVKF